MTKNELLIKERNLALGDQRLGNIKVCRKCGESKSDMMFYINNNIIGGISSQCKSCANAQTMAYCAANRKSVSEKALARRNGLTGEKRDKFIEYNRSYHRMYREKNADKIRRIKRRHQAANSYKVKVERLKAYPEKLAEFKATQAVYQAKRKQATNKMTKLEKKQWLGIMKYCDLKCLKCEEVGKQTLDHVVPVSIGGSCSIGNCQPLCKSCNSSKGRKITDYRTWTMDSDEIGLDLMNYQTMESC